MLPDAPHVAKLMICTQSRVVRVEMQLNMPGQAGQIQSRHY